MTAVMLGRAERLGGGRRGGSGAAAVQTTPPANVAHFRLARSAGLPERRAPTMAPGSSEPTTHDSPNVPMPIDFLT